MVRTQILLEEDQYLRLKDEAQRTGRSMGDLVRSAVRKLYGGASPDEFQAVLVESSGAWAGRVPGGVEYVEATRRGLGRRLEEPAES